MSSNLLSKLAIQFTKTLKKQAIEAKEDLLFKDTPRGGKRIEPELTEDLDQLVQDSMHLVILLQRALEDFKEVAETHNSYIGLQTASSALLDLEDVETALNNPKLLEHDLELDYGNLDVVFQNAENLKSTLAKSKNSISGIFSKLNPNVYRWSSDLLDNADKIRELSLQQSDYLNEQIGNPHRLSEQDVRVPDEISEEELHPDFKSRNFNFEDPEYSGDFDEPFDPLYEKNQRRPGPKTNHKYHDDDSDFMPLSPDND